MSPIGACVYYCVQRGRTWLSRKTHPVVVPQMKMQSSLANNCWWRWDDGHDGHPLWWRGVVLWGRQSRQDCYDCRDSSWLGVLACFGMRMLMDLCPSKEGGCPWRRCETWLSRMLTTRKVEFRRWRRMSSWSVRGWWWCWWWETSNQVR